MTTAFLMAGLAGAALAAAGMLLPLPSRVRMLAVVATGLAVRLFVAVQDPLTLQGWPLNDDSHYYYTIAWNLANGGGLRHDSFHETTGFQPLFLLLLAPVFAIARDRISAITLALIAQVLIGLAGAFAWRGLARRMAGPPGGEAVLAVWAISPLAISLDLSGLETNLSLALLAATAWYALARVLPERSPDPVRLAALGILCGLCFLARVDTAFLGCALALQLVWNWRRTLSRPAIASALAILAAAASLPILPWVAWNLYQAGSILPSSGQAVRFISQAYGFHFLGGNTGGSHDYFEIGRIPATYYLETVRKAARDIVKVCDALFPLVPGALLLAGAAWLRGRAMLERLKEAAFLPVLLGLHFAVYCGYIFGQWFFDRYFTPFALVWLIAVAAACGLLAAEGARRRGLRAAIVAIAASAGALLAGNTATLLATLHGERGSSYYRAAEWANANTPPGAVIGAFQTGIFGYYVARPFHGLDGKINLDALAAMKSRRMDEDVAREKIDYLLDWPWILEDLFTRRSVDPGFLDRQELVRDAEFRAYRLREAGEARQGVRPADPS